jgi:hypothetical protein
MTSAVLADLISLLLDGESLSVKALGSKAADS